MTFTRKIKTAYIGVGCGFLSPTPRHSEHAREAVGWTRIAHFWVPIREQCLETTSVPHPVINSCRWLEGFLWRNGPRRAGIAFGETNTADSRPLRGRPPVPNRGLAAV